MGNAIGAQLRGNYSTSSVGSGNGGGTVEDISRRLDNVETNVSELKPQVAAILGMIPHLATKADVADLKADLKADIGAVKADLKADIGALKADIGAVKADMKADIGALKADIGAVRSDMKADIGAVRSDLKADIGAVKADLKADIAVMKADLAVIPYLATKADLANLETAIIKWLVATVLTSTAVAFTVAKFVH